MPNQRSARHRARWSPAPFVRWGVPLLAVLVAGGFYVDHSMTGRHAGAAGLSGSERHCGTSQDAAPCPQPGSGGPAVQNGTGVPGHLGTHGPAHSAVMGSSGQRPKASPAPSKTGTHTPSPSPTGSGQPIGAAAEVLALINQSRVQAGLPPYQLSPALDSSAESHSLRMANGCGLSHQCLDEPGLGERETLAGLHWTTAGENIAEAGPASNSAQITEKALALTQGMLNETAPNDGHRANIMSRAFRFIGIVVLRDNTGTVWMTQDFAN